MQPNLPCTDNVAFDMERLTRTQAVNRRSALGDLAGDNSLGLEPLRTSGISPLPQDGELTPRTGEINIAVTSKWGPPLRHRACGCLYGHSGPSGESRHSPQPATQTVTKKGMCVSVKTGIWKNETLFMISSWCVCV